jgi:hypothetical protein
MSWVLDHMDDVASDMSVFHRVDDPWSMPAPRFFAFAARLPLYGGAVHAALPRPTQPAYAGPGNASPPDAPAQMDVRQQALLAPDWIEIVKAA